VDGDGVIVLVLCGGGLVAADFVVVLLMRSLLRAPGVKLNYKKLKERDRALKKRAKQQKRRESKEGKRYKKHRDDKGFDEQDEEQADEEDEEEGEAEEGEGSSEEEGHTCSSSCSSSKRPHASCTTDTQVINHARRNILDVFRFWGICLLQQAMRSSSTTRG
jgi:hypothetical protein